MCVFVCACAFVQNMQLKTQSKHVHRQMCVKPTSERTIDNNQSYIDCLRALILTSPICVCVCLELKRSHIYTHIECACA